MSLKCLRVQLKETAEQKKSTVESSYPNLPGSSGLIETGTPNPSRMGPFDSLRSRRADDAVIRFEIGHISKHTPLQIGRISMCWIIFKP